jgi:hypothetical protein
VTVRVLDGEAGLAAAAGRHARAGALVRVVDGLLAVRGPGGEEAAADLLAHLVAAGCRVTDFREERGGLESLFLSVTEGIDPMSADAQRGGTGGARRRGGTDRAERRAGRAVAGPSTNPVLRRELLERWRGRRAMLLLYLASRGAAPAAALARWPAPHRADARLGRPDPDRRGPMLGRFLLENLLALVLGMVLLVAPGYAAAQLAGERERRTLGLLRITLVRPRRSCSASSGRPRARGSCCWWW